MYALKPSATGAKATAAMPPDRGITEPMLISPVIGALAASGSAQSSVDTVHAAAGGRRRCRAVVVVGPGVASGRSRLARPSSLR